MNWGMKRLNWSTIWIIALVADTVHFRYSGHLGPPLSGHYIRLATTVYFRYSGHVYSGHLVIVATFSGTKYIYSIIFRSDIVANQI